MYKLHCVLNYKLINNEIKTINLNVRSDRNNDNLKEIILILMILYKMIRCICDLHISILEKMSTIYPKISLLKFI